MRLLMVLALALLVVAGLGDCRSLSQNPSTSSRSLPGVSAEEKKCLLLGKVLYSDGICYPLLTKGPCATADQWLTLSRRSSPHYNGSRYECSDRPCENPRQFYWLEDERCHSVSELSLLCPYEGIRLRNDNYGDGECACQPAHAQYNEEVMRANQSTDWDGHGNCYPLFRRGPCPEGNILHPQVLAGFGIVGRCTEDFCATLNKAHPDAGYAMHVDDHTCYRLGSRIAACNNGTFDVHEVTNLPSCVEPRPIELLGGFSNIGERCGGGNNVDPDTGLCRGELAVDSKYSPFFCEATGQWKKKRRTRKKHMPDPVATQGSYIRRGRGEIKS